MTDLLKRLEEWYTSNCNGDWEHHHGVEIRSLDNPGWLIDISLAGTPLAGRPFPRLARGVGNDHHPISSAWMDCEVRDDTFRGAGDAHRLRDIVAEFLIWADQELHAQSITIDPLSNAHHDWVSSILSLAWGSTAVVTRGSLHEADQLPGFVASIGDIHVGLATYRLADDACELVTINSLVPKFGVGRRLVESVRKLAAIEQCERVWLITTNDNTPAIRFFQKLGFKLRAIHRDAIERSRELKPEIPDRGVDGIPIRDEIELEFVFPR